MKLTLLTRGRDLDTTSYSGGRSFAELLPAVHIEVWVSEEGASGEATQFLHRSKVKFWNMKVL